MRRKRIEIFEQDYEADAAPMDQEKEYVLGTHDEEIARLASSCL